MKEGSSKPLFTIGVLAFNNYCYIKEAIDSILKQTYSNIQLIVSNDGSSDFNEDELEDYIKNKKRENIKDYVIKNHQENQGTVKNINYVLSQAKGEFFMVLAADDALYSNNVFERFVSEFERLDDTHFIVSAKTAMCGNDLSDIVFFEPQAEGIKAIKTFSPQEMFSRLSHTFTIPTTSSCYKMELYNSMGLYDEEYYIIEDAPLYIKMARLGYKFHWIDDMIAARHRDGGISHGNVLNLSEAYRKYRYDEIILFKKEIFPYADQILPADYKKMMFKWKWVEQNYYELFIQPKESYIDRFKKPLYWKVILTKIRGRLGDYGYRRIRDEIEIIANVGLVCFFCTIMMQYLLADKNFAMEQDIINGTYSIFFMSATFCFIRIVLILLSRVYSLFCHVFEEKQES